jgi:hypothetical protein
MLVDWIVCVVIVLASMPIAAALDSQLDFSRNDVIAQREAARLRTVSFSNWVVESWKITGVFLCVVVFALILDFVFRWIFLHIGIPDNANLSDQVVSILISAAILNLCYPLIYAKVVRKQLIAAEHLDVTLFPPPSDEVLALISEPNTLPAIFLYMRQTRVNAKDARRVIMKLHYFSKPAA